MAETGKCECGHPIVAASHRGFEDATTDHHRWRFLNAQLQSLSDPQADRIQAACLCRDAAWNPDCPVHGW